MLSPVALSWYLKTEIGLWLKSLHFPMKKYVEIRNVQILEWPKKWPLFYSFEAPALTASKAEPVITSRKS